MNVKSLKYNSHIAVWKLAKEELHKQWKANAMLMLKTKRYPNEPDTGVGYGEENPEYIKLHKKHDEIIRKQKKYRVYDNTNYSYNDRYDRYLNGMNNY